PVRNDGRIDRDRLQELLDAAGEPAFVSIQLANNETGVIQPMAELAGQVHAAGGLLHVDAAQAPGRIRVDARALGADAFTLSAHKMGGPQGAGALILLADVAPVPIIRGGGQERGWRAGTENLPGIVGFGVAAELAGSDLLRAAEVAELRDGMERDLTRLGL